MRGFAGAVTDTAIRIRIHRGAPKSNARRSEVEHASCLYPVIIIFDAARWMHAAGFTGPQSKTRSGHTGPFLAYVGSAVVRYMLIELVTV